MLIQRQLKAIGSFARLTLDAHKGNYLRYVLPAIACLPRQQLIDERWSYVSDTLLTQIANSFTVMRLHCCQKYLLISQVY